MGKAAVIFQLIIFDQIISLIRTGFDNFPRYPGFEDLFLDVVFNCLDIFHIDRNNIRVSIIGFRVDILYQFIIRFSPGKMSIYFIIIQKFVKFRRKFPKKTCFFPEKLEKPGSTIKASNDGRRQKMKIQKKKQEKKIV